MKTEILLAAWILVGVLIGSMAFADETLEIKRNPADEDKVFTAQYLESINAEKQLEESQSQQDRLRHERTLNRYDRRN